MNRFTRSFALAKASGRVLRSQPSFFAFPVLGFLANVAVLAVFTGLFVVVGVTQTGAVTGSATAADDYAMTLAGWILILVLYVVMAFVTTLFLAALVIGARERLQGRDVRFGAALSAALKKSPYLLPWAIVQATVSWILSAISQQAGIVGNIVSGLAGAAWSVVTFLAVPIIVNEDVGPVKALKRSGTLVKQTWGENLIGQAGLGIVGALASLPGIVLLVFGIALLGPNLVAGFSMLIVAAMYLALVAAFVSALSGVYRAALYEYATTGQTPDAFASVGFENAFYARTGR